MVPCAAFFTDYAQMARNQALERVVADERRNSLWSRRVFGFPVWSLERLYRWRDELFRDDPSFVPMHRQGFRKMIDMILRPVWYSAADLTSGGPLSRDGRDIWVLSSTGYRRRDAAGLPQCIHAEHLRAQLGDRLLFLETNASQLPRLDRSDVIYIDALLAAAFGFGQMLAPVVARGSAELAAFSPTPASMVCRDAVYGQTMLVLARYWLKRARPSALFVLCGYHFFIPFQIAARELGIPVIELQHGVIHESHPGYMYDVDDLPHLPDHIVVFGSHFGELLERESPAWAGRWSVGGHPWLRRKVAETRLASDRRRVVLFSAPDAATRQRLAAVLPGLAAALAGDFEIVVKPHPLEIDAGSYYAPWGDRVRVAGNLDDSYQLLGGCAVSVCVNSTVAIEALAYPCTSIVLDAPFISGEIRSLIDRGAIQLARTSDDIVAVARRALHSERPQLAAHLFGIDEQPPDFAELIEQVRGSLRGPPRL